MICWNNKLENKKKIEIGLLSRLGSNRNTIRGIWIKHAHPDRSM